MPAHFAIRIVGMNKFVTRPALKFARNGFLQNALVKHFDRFLAQLNPVSVEPNLETAVFVGRAATVYAELVFFNAPLCFP